MNTVDKLNYVLGWLTAMNFDKPELSNDLEKPLNVLSEAISEVENLHLSGASSCYAVFDEEDNIVQLYQTEEKANKGLCEFQNSHPHTEFYVDTMHINQ